MRTLLPYLKPFRKECIISPLFKLLEALLELFVPLIMAAIIDKGILGGGGTGDIGYVLRMGLALVGLGLLGFACSVTAQFFAAKAAVGFTAKVKTVLFGHIQQLSYTELDRIGTVERIKGKNRYETSVVIAQRYFGSPKAAVLAYAQGFPDGLCGGPLAMNMGAPLILTSNESPAAADAYIEGITVGAVTGGTGRITDDTVRAIFDLAEDTEIPIP